MFKFLVIWSMKRNIKIMEKTLRDLDSKLLACQNFPDTAKQADEIRKRYDLISNLLRIHKAKVLALHSFSTVERKEK